MCIVCDCCKIGNGGKSDIGPTIIGIEEGLVSVPVAVNAVIGAVIAVNDVVVRGLDGIDGIDGIDDAGRAPLNDVVGAVIGAFNDGGIDDGPVPDAVNAVIGAVNAVIGAVIAVNDVAVRGMDGLDGIDGIDDGPVAVAVNDDDIGGIDDGAVPDPANNNNCIVVIGNAAFGKLPINSLIAAVILRP